MRGVSKSTSDALLMRSAGRDEGQGMHGSSRTRLMPFYACRPPSDPPLLASSPSCLRDHTTSIEGAIRQTMSMQVVTMNGQTRQAAHDVCWCSRIGIRQQLQLTVSIRWPPNGIGSFRRIAVQF
jgi:hypothetical protein